MKPPKLRLVKSYRMSQEPPGTLKEFIERFLDTKIGTDEDTRQTYGAALKKFHSVSGGAWPPTTKTVGQFIAHCQEHYTAGTTATYYATVQMFLDWLLRRGHIVGDPTADISRPKPPSLAPHAPPEKDLNALFGYLEREAEKVITKKTTRYPNLGWYKVRDLALFSLLLDTGLRIHEALALTIDDLDLSQGLVFVGTAKGDKQRYALLAVMAKADLKFWLSYREELGVPADNQAIFVTRYRVWRTLSINRVEKALKGYCKTLKIKAFTPHDLRHAYAIYAMQNGLRLNEVSTRLGHSNLATTARYLVIPDENQRRLHRETSPRDKLRGR